MPGMPKLILERSGIQDEYQGIIEKTGLKARVPKLHSNCYVLETATEAK